MQFNQNKTEPIHRWYPFVEGYSKEFITSIISEQDNAPQVCLEPFSGSGTTSLELQKRGIPCHSFEVNPFMFLLASVKLENTYNSKCLVDKFEQIKGERHNIKIGDITSEFSTLFENGKNKKWNYHREAGNAVRVLLNTINDEKDKKYKDLFLVGLAAILLDVSNLYRNGKCLSYKRDWKERRLTKEEVFARFDKKIEEQILPDILAKEKCKVVTSNKQFLYQDDARKGIDLRIPNDSVDLVITSPPYLNSRDYTDTYMLELKTLGMTPSLKSIKALREKTIRSHVQINWKDEEKENDPLLLKTFDELEEGAKNSDVWNDSILDMINLYFVDLRAVFHSIYKKLKNNGKVYFNVSNSAYFNVLVNTIEICASIAESEGFIVREVREARKLKTSPQQKETIGSLLEAVIVLEKRV